MMTIGDLIAQLQQFMPEIPVFVYDDWDDFPLAPLGPDSIEACEPEVVAGDGLARPQRLVLRRIE